MNYVNLRKAIRPFHLRFFAAETSLVTDAASAGSKISGCSARTDRKSSHAARKFRSQLAALLIVAAGVACAVPPASWAGPLIPHESAARLGLERFWFAQIPLDAQQSRVSRWLIYFDRLYAVSSTGLLTAINAETGEVLWTSRVGKPGYPAFGPGANDRYVASVSGARLYLFDRDDGRLLSTRDLGSAPASGPALTKGHAYIALMNGQVEGFRLDDSAARPWYYQSKGRTFQRPTTTGDVVSWPTDTGFLYVSSADSPRVLFRLETNDEIVTSPSELKPYLYIASLDGYLYCIHELTGRERWRFAAGGPIDSSPAVVEDAAYVASTEPVLHAVDLASGNELWQISGIQDFASRGKRAVYGQAWGGALVAIDPSTGIVQASVPLEENVQALVNDQTDRIFLVSPTGLVQCLREFDALRPWMHRKSSSGAGESIDAEAAQTSDENPFLSDEPENADEADEEQPASADDAPLEREAPTQESEETSPDSDSSGPGDADPFGF